MEPRNDAHFYRSLGLVANPFVARPEEDVPVGTALEITAATNRLFGAIAGTCDGPSSGVIVVDKSPNLPSYYGSRSVGHVESMLINDEGFGVLHAYIQLYMLRKGRIRSTLGVVGERLAFRSFDETLAALVRRVLDNPDAELPSFAALEQDRLETFRAAFEADAVGAVVEYFGTPDLERRADLSEVVDIRLAGMDADVEEAESTLEVDDTVGSAPGTGMLLPAADEDDKSAVVDYIIEYTDQHLSKVIARALRMYVERGLAAVSTELKVTRAPRKTLQAVVDLATTHFRKVAIIYDGFENWNAIEPPTKETIVGAFREMQELLGSSAVFCFLLENGAAAEVREAFADAVHVAWDYEYLVPLQSEPETIDAQMIDSWLAAATIHGATPLTLADPGLTELLTDSGGELSVFVAMAAAAIEDAASRGAASLDAAAVAAGQDARVAVEEGEETD